MKIFNGKMSKINAILIVFKKKKNSNTEKNNGEILHKDELKQNHL